ncbi:MAG: sulfatase [Planctomycetes bacterium]|nr:sulfatase [Planctomycetota bacterium]
MSRPGKQSRRDFLRTVGVGAAALVWPWGLRAGAASAAGGGQRLNVLFITADDMNYNTPGVVGCKVPDITPNIDRLAAEGIRFRQAHVTVAVCQPSRECLMTGRYPHRNGAVGFYPVNKDVPTLQESLKAAGYHLGILGKVVHLRPAEKFPWDFQHDQGELGMGRDPAIYYRYTKEFLQQAKDAGKPFFLMANSHDPHRPFAGSEGPGAGGRAGKKRAATKAAAVPADEAETISSRAYPQPSRIYKPEEITVPGFLPDLPDVRKELAQYYSSAHRCDQTVGEVLRALKESGLEESTLVMFLSDNGISMPFAKSNCYLTSTRTPWIVRWPGKVKPGVVDEENLISGIDYMPTILEAAGLPPPAGMDGRSFLPLLAGDKQDGRDRVFTCYNETSGRKPYPMRCLQMRRFGYIFNAWSDGKTTYQAEPMSGLAFKAMKQAAAAEKPVADRVEMLLHRVPEEFYDFEADPDALRNLAGDPRYKDNVRQMRADLLAWMERTADPLIDAYRKYLVEKPL